MPSAHKMIKARILDPWGIANFYGILHHNHFIILSKAFARLTTYDVHAEMVVNDNADVLSNGFYSKITY